MLDAHDVEELRPRVAEAAQLMQMMAQPVRLELLCKLMEGETSVLALANAVHLSQPAASHHLKRLRDAGLVETRRDAQTIYYALKGTEVTEVMGVLHRLYCADDSKTSEGTDGVMRKVLDV